MMLEHCMECLFTSWPLGQYQITLLGVNKLPKVKPTTQRYPAETGTRDLLGTDLMFYRQRRGLKLWSCFTQDSVRLSELGLHLSLVHFTDIAYNFL